ncbi:phage tail length tape measure family protein [Phaeobacter sp. PT47_59]|uniref:phage tail length tape measure family protein n=1 Tax=Phaeobacter sp. PT47_59 TaxID=3029979 RepID=UPI002380BA6C|nr:phage tail length tape measure family protein [Phaeobacter sp. PT47_59]MDE4175804.1 phage tail length tape measure family protein [Phaeobacter sp. PT47_59]
MPFVVSGKVLLDASQAKQDLVELKGTKDATAKSATVLSFEEEKAARKIKQLGTAADAAASRTRALDASQDGLANRAVRVGRTHQVAAGQIGNITAQFNDIGVMLAAGQNPLQLAIQQGTQITQAFGDVGAAGAVNMLRQGLLRMISPLNLITIGGLAAGAATIQWMLGSAEAAETLEDRIEATGDAIEAFQKKSQKARLGVADMIEEFGSASPVLRQVLADMAALAKIDAFHEIDKTTDSLRNLVLEAGLLDGRSSMSMAQDFLGIGSVGRANREAGHLFASNLELLSRSEDMAVKYAAALDVRSQLLDAAGGLEGLNSEQREFYDGLTALIRDLEVFGGRIQEPWLELKATGTDLWKSLQTSAGSYLNERLKIETAARNTIAQLQTEAALQEAIKAHGAGSVEAAELRLEAERRAYQQQVDGQEISEALKTELMAAWDAANGVAEADMAGNITLAADEAHRLKTNLLAARGNEILGRIRSNPDYHDPRGESPGAGKQDYVYQDMDLPRVNLPANPRSSRGRGGANQFEQERKAIERLIAAERRRLDILRETDPVMQEMIRHREALKGATDAEREAVEALVRERLEEEKALQQTKEAADWLKATGQDLGVALMSSGDAAADAWDRVREAIIRAAAQAVLFGDGPFAKILGTGGGLFGGSDGKTSLLGQFVSGLFGFADGTVGMMVYGDGGNRDDKVPAWLSPGESVITAKATRKYRPLLQAMNDGVEIPGFASGTVPAGGTTSAPTSSGSAQDQPLALVRIAPSPLFEAYVEETAGRVSVETIDHYDRTVAPDTIDRQLNDPWRRG